MEPYIQSSLLLYTDKEKKAQTIIQISRFRRWLCSLRWWETGIHSDWKVVLVYSPPSRLPYSIWPHSPNSQTYTQASPQSRKNEQWQAMTLSDWGWCYTCSSVGSKNLAQRNNQSCDLTHLWDWECQSSWEVKMMEDTWLKRRLEPNSSKELDLRFPFHPSGHPVPQEHMFQYQVLVT